MKKGWDFALPAAVVFAGIAAIVFVLVANAKSSRSDQWRQVRATIERVDGASVTYRYLTADGPKRSTATGAGPYAVDSQLLVYVNPSDPAESLLQLPPRPPLWPALAGGLAILVGAALGVYVWRKPPVQRKAVAAPRKAAPPLSRLRPPPAVKRAAPVHDDVTSAD